MLAQPATLVELCGEQVQARLFLDQQQPPALDVDRCQVQQLRPRTVRTVEHRAQRHRQRTDRGVVVVGEQPLDIGFLQPGDGDRTSIDRSSIDQGAPCSARSGRNESAQNASGPLTPAPFQVPLASISSATAG